MAVIVHHGFDYLMHLRMFGSIPGETGYVFKLYTDTTAVTDATGFNATDLTLTAHSGTLATITTMADGAATLTSGAGIFKVTSITGGTATQPTSWSEVAGGGYTPRLIKFGPTVTTGTAPNETDTFQVIAMAGVTSATLWTPGQNITTTGGKGGAWSGSASTCGTLTMAANSGSPLFTSVTLADLVWTFTGAITGTSIKKVGVYSLSTGVLCFSETLAAASYMTPANAGDNWTFRFTANHGSTSGSLT